MNNITSRQNPEIMAVAALAQAKERALQGKFLAEGLRVCSALIKSSLRLCQLYVTEEALPSVSHLVKSTLITVVSKPVIEKISQATTPSGIVGVFYIPARLDPSVVQSGLVLANISDPGNMGTLIRSCVALNIKSVIIVDGADVWSPKVIQATAGMIGKVAIFTMSFEELVRHKGSKKLCALVVSGGKKPSPTYNNDLLIVGNEAHGISPEWLALCDEKLTIPMPGPAESLNAAVAGSLALYLVFNQ